MLSQPDINVSWGIIFFLWANVKFLTLYNRDEYCVNKIVKSWESAWDQDLKSSTGTVTFDMYDVFQDKELIDALQGLEDCISMLGAEFEDLVGKILVGTFLISVFLNWMNILTLIKQVDRLHP